MSPYREISWPQPASLVGWTDIQWAINYIDSGDKISLPYDCISYIFSTNCKQCSTSVKEPGHQMLIF